MRDLMSVALALLLCGSSPPCHARQRQPLEGNWTGGFWLKGNWVVVNVRLNSQNENPSGTADIFFPSYGGSQNVRNVTLSNLKQSSADLHFEIPFGAERVVFDGRHKDRTISGDYNYNEAKGSFGLTRVTIVTVESLEKYYGAYRVSSDRVISIFRAWGDPRTLNYVDYKTGQIGTLWTSSENEFFSGPGRTSFPVALKVSFAKDPSGNVKSLLWQSPDEPNLTARKIETKEERMTFKNGDITLSGTLILPATKGQHAVVIVTPGDFGTNRNVLRMWAENFVAGGIAALVFDARGGGESTGIVNSNSFSDLANDVLAIVESLKTREDINPKQIGLFGFSNSCWTITLAASRSKDVGFLILQSMSGVPPWKQESFRAETQLRADNFPESTVKQGADFMRLKFEAARTGAGWEQIQKIINQAASERWLAYTNPPRSLERLQQSWPRLWSYDPGPALEKLKIPVLAYWGDKDTYVPAHESIAIFKQAMAKAGNKNYVVKVYPNGSHSLLKTDSGGPSTEAKEINFMPGFWTMQIDWLLRHVSIPK
jgi:pimeloyl-ACP methyl ester carboxylesterase